MQHNSQWENFLTIKDKLKHSIRIKLIALFIECDYIFILAIVKERHKYFVEKNISKKYKDWLKILKIVKDSIFHAIWSRWTFAYYPGSFMELHPWGFIHLFASTKFHPLGWMHSVASTELHPLSCIHSVASPKLFQWLPEFWYELFHLLRRISLSLSSWSRNKSCGSVYSIVRSEFRP